MFHKKLTFETIDMSEQDQKQFLQEIYDQKTPRESDPLTDEKIEELKLKDFIASQM